jgi:hypothetical protein
MEYVDWQGAPLAQTFDTSDQIPTLADPVQLRVGVPQLHEPHWAGGTESWLSPS